VAKPNFLAMLTTVLAICTLWFSRFAGLSQLAEIAAVGVACGVDWRIALVAALGLAMSSTAIGLGVLAERNLMATSSGQGVLSVMLLQDVAAIPILAFVPLLAGAGAAHEGGGWWGAAKAAAVIAIIVLGGRLLLRPALRWIARSRTPEIFTAASLLLVVATAALMQSVGLSMALGAFLAGVLLAESEYRRELETDIEPFKGLLMGLFFVAVGMSIDFGVLLASPGLMLAALLGFLALKMLTIAALARLLGLPPQERPVFTLLLAQGGEFAFVVFRAAADVNALPADVASLLVGAVALSMLLTPLALVAVDRWLLPRYANCGRPPAPPELSEPQSAPVIIAGFGRYGQIVSRLLGAEGVAVTVLDHDAEMIEAARVLGSRVFYGDATRLDLLRTAGAAEARILVVAVDDVEQSLAIVDLARQHFPQLELVARARDVTHWHQLRDRGVMRVQRELFESSLVSGRGVLELLGASAEAARFSADRFRHHNLALFEQMHPYHKDRAKLISVMMRGRLQFEEQLAQEREQAAHAAAANALPPAAPSDGAERA
jgi:glutathione-regulated potassium-efflux system ancillary protein KefC